MHLYSKYTLSQNAPKSDTFQLRWHFFKFIQNFQLQPELSNFSETFQFQTFQLLVFSNCPFQLHVSKKTLGGLCQKNLLIQKFNELVVLFLCQFLPFRFYGNFLFKRSLLRLIRWQNRSDKFRFMVSKWSSLG